MTKMISKNDQNSSIKSTDSRKNIKKKMSNAKLISGICNTAFTLEEKLQSKGYSNFKNSEDAKSSDEDANILTTSSKIDLSNGNIENKCVKSRKQEGEEIFDDKDLVICRNQDNSEINKEHDQFSADIQPTKECRKNSDIKFAVQNLSCGLNSMLAISNKDSNSSDYVKQHSKSSDINCTHNSFCSNLCNLSNCRNAHQDEHNIEIHSEVKIESKSKILATLKGIFLAFFSSIFFSLTAVIVKYAKDVDAGQMAIYRFAGMLLFVFPIATNSKQNIFGPSNLRHWILLRGLAGASSLYLRYSALHYLALSNATVVVLSMPVFVCVFGRIFLKEACGLFHVFALLVTLIGIAFTSKLNLIFSGNDDNQDKNMDRINEIYGLINGLGAALVGSSAYIIVRKVKELHFSIILFNFAWVSLLESFVITSSIHDGLQLPKDNITPWLLTGLGILSFYGQMMLTQALQAEEAALVSVTRSASEVFFSFLFQIIFFREIPSLQSIIGASLVTSAVMLISVRKCIINLPEEHLARKFFWFTLR